MKNVCRLAVGLLLSACTAAEAPEPGTASPPDAAAADSVAARMLGTWQVAPSPEDARKAEVLALALGEMVPDEAQIAAAGLSPAEEGMVRALLAARADNPEAPELQRMRTAMQGVQTAEMQITADEMTFRLGARSHTRTYRVVQADALEARLETREPSGAVEINLFLLEGRDGNSALLIEPDGETSRLLRVAEGG